MLLRLFNNMELSVMMVMMWTLMVMAAADPHCDPDTQYLKGGQCCNMCGPGKRMQETTDCKDPMCQPCQDDEFQDRYTTETKCQRQPVCDPNKNFEVPVSRDPKKRSNCMCKEGFHCVDRSCTTCVPHTLCGLGSGALSIGNHTHDTECEICSHGTFSSDHSWDDTCRPWTICHWHVSQQGTATSDTVCGAFRLYTGLIVAAVLFVILVILAALLFFCLRRHQKGQTKENIKQVCPESRDQETVPLKETIVPITNPTDEQEFSLPELPSSQEEGGMRTPEENEDELSTEISADPVLTENGNLVTQENGKTSIISRQESQTKTFTD